MCQILLVLFLGGLGSSAGLPATATLSHFAATFPVSGSATAGAADWGGRTRYVQVCLDNSDWSGVAKVSELKRIPSYLDAIQSTSVSRMSSEL